MQFLLLVQQLPLLYLILRRLVVREEVFLVDRCEVRVVEVVGYLLLVDDFLALLLDELVVLQLLRRIAKRGFGACFCWARLLLFHVYRDYSYGTQMIIIKLLFLREKFTFGVQTSLPLVFLPFPNGLRLRLVIPGCLLRFFAGPI